MVASTEIKTKVRENLWFTPYNSPNLLTAELFFKLCIPQSKNILVQRYVQNLERNWKNFVCIGVKNIANLYFSRLHGRLHQKVKKHSKLCIKFSM